MQYLILQNPGHNRVYYKAADKLALAELKIAATRLSMPITDLAVVELARVRYLSFECAGELTESDFIIISRLSFLFALYRREGELLAPVEAFPGYYINPKIGSLLKYHGKTNELFTRMMVNVAALSAGIAPGDVVELLDPCAGRGTTLYEGAIYGYNCYGVELDAKSVQEGALFFKKYLEEERYKHKASSRQVAGTTKSDAVYINEFEYNKSKKEEVQKRLGLVCGDTQEMTRYFKNSRFHLIVGDLPYGIAHNNSSARDTRSMRNPSELLDGALDQWCKVLKKGGVIALAWNSFLVSRSKLAELFESKGLQVLDGEPYQELEHMVDKSIKRDVILAVRG